MLGGFHDERQLDPEELAMVQSLQGQIECQVNKEFTTFQPISIKSQVVAGMNYWVKIGTDNDEYLHVKIYQSLPYTGLGPEITEIIQGKAAGDPLP